ncbi:MAG TPA: hypothetical protein VIX18_04075, partial [Nitrospirota bacterium]
MSCSDDGKKARAGSASGEELAALLHDPSPEVIKAILTNSNLSDDDVLVIVNRKNVPAHLLDMIARDERWKDSYPVRLALAKNPKTPLSVSLSIVRYLHLFDIAEMTRSPLIPLAFRHKLEAIVMERIPTMPLGNKKSLAKMAVGNVLFKLLQDAESEVVALCLDNPRMPESHLYSALKHQGKPLYEYARAGIIIERPARPVLIRSIDILEFGGDTLIMDVTCSAGTYIRTLAEDIGRMLGCGAHLTRLTRLASGGFSLTDAVTLAQLEQDDVAQR